MTTLSKKISLYAFDSGDAGDASSLEGLHMMILIFKGGVTLLLGPPNFFFSYNYTSNRI